jgi:hypothetical protein
MDALAGRRLFPILGVFAKQKPQAQNPHGWPAWMPAVSISWGFAQQNPRPKSGTEAAFGQRKG